MSGRKKLGRQRVQSRAANSRRRKKRRTGKKVIHYILLLTFVLAAGVVLSLTTFFKIEQILVVGTDKYTPADIIAASGIQKEENLFRVNAVQVRENLLTRFPYIQSVDIRRKLPPAIELRITQSVPAAAILEQDRVVLITKEGKVLEQGDLFVPNDVPVVKGLAVNGVVSGQMLGEDSEEGLRMLGDLFDALNAGDFGTVTNVDISDRLNMKIIYENRYLLLLGTEADLSYKLDMLKEIIAQEPPDGQGRIDVSNARDKEAIIKDITLEQALASDRGTGHSSETDKQQGSKPETGEAADGGVNQMLEKESG